MWNKSLIGTNISLKECVDLPFKLFSFYIDVLLDLYSELSDIIMLVSFDMFISPHVHIIYYI